MSRISTISSTDYNIFIVLFIGLFVISTLFREQTIAFASTDLKVSFYGASYVSLPFEDARSTTKVSFRLKTNRNDAILFLSAGPIDYCLIAIDNGVLKLRINLGSGEALLTSKNGLKLNDLMWHQIEIDRHEGKLTMTVDGLHTTYLEIPGKHFELNIKYGIYVGGLGDFSELFLGNLRPFRGCIDNLRFNEINVFETMSKSNDAVLESVTFDCSNEFDGSPNSAISFVDPLAFVVIPGFTKSRLGSTLLFNVKTVSEMAILFYSSGSTNQLADFVAVEIINGKISLSANDGNGVVVLQSDVIVNDGSWHKVELRFSTSYLEISVDEKSRNLRPSLGDNKFYDLSDSLFVGGLELNKQSFAFQQGLQTVLSQGTEISLKGCLKDIVLNEHRIGIREAEISKGIKVGECLWQYPCLTDSPCLNGAKCYQKGFNGFRCVCTTDYCLKLNITINSKVAGKSYDKGTEDTKNVSLTTVKMHPLATDVSRSNGSTFKQAELDNEMIRPQINYFNIIITRDHLLITAVVAFILLSIIIILIVIRVSSQNSFRASTEKTDSSDNVRQYSNDSNTGSDFDGDAVLMNSNRQISMRSTPSDIDACIPPPTTSSSVSTNCESVTDHHSRSVTPLKTYAMPILSSHRLRTLGEEIEMNRNKNSVFPLPPPSLYFGAESTSDRIALSSPMYTFHPNTLPPKLTPSSLNYAQESNFHNNGQSPDPSTVRMMADGTSNNGTPLPSLRKHPWSSEDLTNCMPPPFTRSDRCITCNPSSKCLLMTRTFYGNDSSQLRTLATPATPLLCKRQHYWV